MKGYKDMAGYEDYYEISNTGRIRNKTTGYFPKQTLNSYGHKTIYIYVNGSGKMKGVHRLVAETYIPNPEKMAIVNHVNGIKADNRVENLEWVSIRENVCHAESLNERSSKYIGVDKKGKTGYVARVQHNGENVYLGYSKTEEGAYKLVVDFHTKNNIINKYI